MRASVFLGVGPSLAHSKLSIGYNKWITCPSRISKTPSARTGIGNFWLTIVGDWNSSSHFHPVTTPTTAMFSTTTRSPGLLRTAGSQAWLPIRNCTVSRCFSTTPAQRGMFPAVPSWLLELSFSCWRGCTSSRTKRLTARKPLTLSPSRKARRPNSPNSSTNTAS